LEKRKFGAKDDNGALITWKKMRVRKIIHESKTSLCSTFYPRKLVILLFLTNSEFHTIIWKEKKN